MTEQKIMNRWIVVLGALIIQVSLGAVYIWSVFKTPLSAMFPSWTPTMLTLPSQLVLGSFALAVIFGGRIQDRLGPRKVATAGGIILGAGLILARFSGSVAPSMALPWLIGTFSVLGGVGIGMAYVCPIATCVKWFPDKRGLITGLAVAGFGAGAFFFAPLATGLISGKPYSILGANLFKLPAIGLFNTFLALGLIFLVAVVIGAQALRNPPPGYAPAGWTPPQKAQGKADGKADFAPSEMLATPMFWVLWVTYFVGCTAGLGIIMTASPIWQSFQVGRMVGAVLPPIPADQFKNILTVGGMAVSILAIFNALGRIAWGKVSDSIGRKASLCLMFIICGCGMIALDRMRSYGLYATGISIIGFCFGGFLAIYPAVTADFYGTRHYGVNYGWMFSAYGAGGLLGPILIDSWLKKTAGEIAYQAVDKSGTVVDKVFRIGDYSAAFIAAGVACLVAGVAVVALMKPPAAPAAASGDGKSA